MMKKTHLLVVLVCGALMGLGAVLASGCLGLPGLACTQIGCIDEASIWLRGLEPDHAYEITVETGDESSHCTIDTSEGLSMTCDGSTFYSSRLDEARIGIPETPESLAITVWQDGAMIAQDVVMPEYQELAPNGRECGPICLQATIPFDL